MTRNTLGDIVAREAGCAKAKGRVAIDAALDAIRDGLKNGDEIRLDHFGTFTAPQREASVARNPRTGEKVDVPAHRAIKFKPNSRLKHDVNA